MIKRYKKEDDAVPHEENILILTSTGKCYSEGFTDLVDEIRGKIRGDKLLIEEYFHSLSDLANHDKLIQNSVWVIHWNECLEDTPYPRLDFYLDSEHYPNEAEVIICVDSGNPSTASAVESKYPAVSVAQRKDVFIAYASAHLNGANPITSGGRKKIMSWNNEVCDELGVY